MAKLLFNKGSYAALQAKIANGDTFTDGALYLTTDEGGLYLGDGSKSLTRVQGSVLFFESLEAFTQKTKPPYSTDVIYFVAKENALVRWNGEKWIQLNETADGVQAIVTNLQSQIDALSAKATTLESNLTKEVNRATAAEATLTTELGKKATTEALTAETNRAKGVEADFETRISDLEADNTTNTSDIDSLKATVAEHTTSIAANTKAISDETTARTAAVSALETSKVSKTDYDKKITTIEGNITTATSNAANAQSTADKAVSDAASAASAAAKAQTTADNAAAAITAEETRATKAESGLSDSIAAETSRATIKETALQSSVDSLSSGKVNKNGDTMTGDLKMGDGTTNHQIKNLADPTVASDAANMGYVDKKITAANEVASGLDTRVTAVEKKADDNATNITKLTSTVDGINSTVASQGTKITSAEANIKTLQDTMATKVDETTYNDKVTDLETGISEAKTAAAAAQSDADSISARVTSIEKDYANKTYVDNKTSAVLGTSADTADKNTVYGAKAAAAAAQSTATTANNTANSNATKITTLQSTLDSHVAAADAAYVKVDGSNAMTGALDMGSKKITNVADPTDAQDAATKAYVDNAMQTADAMTFCGVLGQSPATLPAGAVNKGDTYKVGVAGTYAGIVAKVGDLFIYNGDDATTAVAANWVHVSSGYEDDYLQKLKYDSTNNVFYLTDGVHTENSNNQGIFKVVSNNDNLQISISSEGAITVDLVWGTF